MAAGAAAVVAPGGAIVELRPDGRYVVARVASRSPLLPGLVIEGHAVAAVEPGS